MDFDGFSHHIGNVIIPTDELTPSFFGVAKNQQFPPFWWDFPATELHRRPKETGMAINCLSNICSAEAALS